MISKLQRRPRRLEERSADGSLSRASAPLYARLAEDLRNKITARQFQPGDRLPTETELGAQFGLSRITVRQALAMLTQEGLIERFPSRGSFVVDRVDTTSWELRSITDLVQVGKDMTTAVIDWRVVPASQEIATLFANPGPVYRLRAVRSQQSVPLYYVENYIRHSVGSRIDPGELNRHTIVELLLGKLSIAIGHANEEIGIGYANAIMAKHLWVPPKQPLIVQKIDLFDKDGLLLQSGRGWWRGERFKRRFVLAH